MTTKPNTTVKPAQLALGTPDRPDRAYATDLRIEKSYSGSEVYLYAYAPEGSIIAVFTRQALIDLVESSLDATVIDAPLPKVQADTLERHDAAWHEDGFYHSVQVEGVNYALDSDDVDVPNILANVAVARFFAALPAERSASDLALDKLRELLSVSDSADLAGSLAEAGYVLSSDVTA